MSAKCYTMVAILYMCVCVCVCVRERERERERARETKCRMFQSHKTIRYENVTHPTAISKWLS